MATALGSGYPVAFALPGAAILTIVLAAIAGFFAAGDYLLISLCGPYEWLSAGVLNLGGLLGGRTRHPHRHSTVQYGDHASAFKNRRRPVGDHGAIVRASSRGFGHFCCIRGRPVSRNNGHRWGHRGCNGHDFPACYAAQQIPIPCDRDNCGVGHIGSDHSALNRFDHLGGPVGLCHGPSVNLMQSIKRIHR